MPDIFISYSHTDSEHALSLAERLRGQGISVWIDQHGIEGASLWSQEIVEAIEGCQAFLLLLSKNSAQSKQVVREVSLASDKERSILPLTLEEFELPSTLKYPLAGVQRLAYSDFDAIIRSLNKLGVAATSSEQIVFPPTPPDPLGRKTLAVLPIEDLHLDQENSWFADGLTQELINVLSQIRGLRVRDRKSVKNYDTTGKSAQRMADELGVQYLLEGTVRIFNKQMRITVELIDAGGGDHLWSQTFKGTLEDVFEMQEQVALEIADALKINLTLEERTSVGRRLTENMEAYERFVRAEEAVISVSREGFQHAGKLLTEAVALDPAFATAWAMLASVRVHSYFFYDRTAGLLDAAEHEARTALNLDPRSAMACVQLGVVAAYRQDRTQALELAHQALRLETDNGIIQMWRGNLYDILGDSDRAIEASEYAVRLSPDNLFVIQSLAFQYALKNQIDHVRTLASKTFPYFERHIFLHPVDYTVRGCYIPMLMACGQREEAYALIDEMWKEPLDRSLPLIGLAITFIIDGDFERAISVLERVRGLSMAFYALVSPLFRQLRHHPQYASLLRQFREDAGMPSRVGK